MNFRGRIVMTPDPQRKRPNRSTEKEIDPTSVSATQEGFGPFYCRAEDRFTTNEWCRSFTNPPPLLDAKDESNKDLLTLYRSTPSSHINVDVYTYNEQTPLLTTTATRKHGYFHLHRSAPEPVVDTLRRLVLRYQQQRASPLPQHQRPRKKQHATMEDASTPPTQESNDAESQVPPRIQIWRQKAVVNPSDALQRSKEVETEVVDVTQLSNWDLCQLGWQSPLVVSIADGEDEVNTKEEKKNTAVSSFHCFSLECYPPTVFSISTFDYWGTCLFVGVPVLIQVETMYATHSRVDWYVDGHIYQSTWNSKHMYTPLAEHVNKKVTLLVVPCRIFASSTMEHQHSHTGVGCERAYRFHKLVAPLPTQSVLQMRAPWLLQKYPPASSQGSSGARTLRVMTYNILADTNAQSFQGFNYPNVAKDILAKDRRLPLIVHEILRSEADILCLQEVDFTVFETLLLPILQQFNYQGYYSGKQGETSNEGCALFWSLSTFAPVPPNDQKTFAIKNLLMRGYGKEVEDWSSVFETLWSLLLRRPDLQLVLATKLAHIAQMVPLTLLKDPSLTPTTIWVTNTHLYYHPQASHIRLLQMLLLARQMTVELRQRPGEMILCGDFNSSLEHSAGKLVLDRLVPANFRESQVHLNAFRDRSMTSSLVDDGSDGPATEDEFPAFALPPSFPNLQSGLQPAPTFTHSSHDFCGTLDHILYSSTGRLRYRSSAPMPSMADVGSALPNPQVPSDHVSVVCDLELLDNLDEVGSQITAN